MITQLELADLILSFPALQRLDDALLRTLCGGSCGFDAQKGETVFDLYSHSVGAAMVTRGKLRVLMPVDRHRNVQFCKVSPGEVCVLTLLAALNRNTYSVRGIAEGRVSGVWITCQVLGQLLNESPDFRSFVFECLGTRVAGAMKLVEEALFKTVDQRLAALLLERGEIINHSHQQLAEELASAREVVSRKLEEWSGAGIVELGRQHIRLVDRGRLAVISDAGHAGEGRSGKIPTDSCISGHQPEPSDPGSPMASNGSSLQR